VVAEPKEHFSPPFPSETHSHRPEATTPRNAPNSGNSRPPVLDSFHDSQYFRIPKELTPAQKPKKIRIVVAGCRFNGDLLGERETQPTP
jgi:hypothetical protein